MIKIKGTNPTIHQYIEEVYPLDNFSAFGVVIDGIEYKTAEHAFQSIKFERTTPHIAKLIRESSSPFEARTLAHKYKSQRRGDWSEVKYEIMEFPLENKHMSGINPLFVGSEKCAPSHSYGPAVRNYCLIHYIRRGCGMFSSRGKSHRLSAGDAFVINKGEITFYQADKDDPWEYVWVAFDGELSERFATLTDPVLRLPSEPFESLIRAEEYPGELEAFVASAVWRIYAETFGRDGDGEKGERRRIAALPLMSNSCAVP